MDEVDKIIMHNLKQIGCDIPEDIQNLSGFTPELLVSTISTCLTIIKPSTKIPKILPAAIPQRFHIATLIADECASIGFKGDVGYQTFLYSNVGDVRKLYMFLIEMLPKENDQNLGRAPNLDDYALAENEIVKSISVPLNSLWVPQYCKTNCIIKFTDFPEYFNVENIPFEPIFNLYLPHGLLSGKEEISPNLRQYWSERSPSLYQQLANYSPCASIIVDNDYKVWSSKMGIKKDEAYYKSVFDFYKNKNSEDTIKDIKKIRQQENNISNPISEIKTNLSKYSTIKEELLDKRKVIQEEISKMNDVRLLKEQQIAALHSKRKLLQRANIIFEEPNVNIEKFNELIQVIAERKKKLTDKWEEYRKTLQNALEQNKSTNVTELQSFKIINKKLKNVRENLTKTEEDIKYKSDINHRLQASLQTMKHSTGRKAYTNRILDTEEQIKKQKSDIVKILQDTKDLQREVNSITGYLDRQFTVTDDILFEVAQRDEYSKKAYKLLASLHELCSHLTKYIRENGLITREIKDLEDQIGSDINISTNLKLILSDLSALEHEYKILKQKHMKLMKT